MTSWMSIVEEVIIPREPYRTLKNTASLRSQFEGISTHISALALSTKGKETTLDLTMPKVRAYDSSNRLGYPSFLTSVHFLSWRMSLFWDHPTTMTASWSAMTASPDRLLMVRFLPFCFGRHRIALFVSRIFETCHQRLGTSQKDRWLWNDRWENPFQDPFRKMSRSQAIVWICHVGQSPRYQPSQESSIFKTCQILAQNAWQDSRYVGCWND